MRVQEELVRRRVVKISANGKKRSYSYNHCSSQIIICGEMFRKIHCNNHGCKSVVWRYISRLESTVLECHVRTLYGLDLQEIVVAALNKLLDDKSKYQHQLQQNIATVIRTSATSTIDAIDKKLMKLQQELVKKANSKESLPNIFLSLENSPISCDEHRTWWANKPHHRPTRFHQSTNCWPYKVWRGPCETLAKANHSLARPLHRWIKIRIIGWHWQININKICSSSPLELNPVMGAYFFVKSDTRLTVVNYTKL